ncbi:kynurenine--oxoglutarate transaminase 3-like [Actinia tenebrosa]|uniref:Kynurenine--oxoglutarate transaminase 3-like n=1 Tax=Actinia tenebrosa TaxID=6105 RepID=A0A6P8HMP6_ACTTE|nr:kynurenine--oxoglutarate transaminase 3-like [Actinia tenebrosa]
MLVWSVKSCRSLVRSRLVKERSFLLGCFQTIVRGSPVCSNKIAAEVFQARDMSTSKTLIPAQRVAEKPLNIWQELTDLARIHGKVNLGQGMPDFNPPHYVNDALSQAAQSADVPMQQYSRGQGNLRLTNALARMFSKLHGREINPMTEVVVTVGAYEALFDSFMAFVNPGEEVILFDPCFDCYYNQIRLAGGKPVYVTLQQKKGATTAKDWIIDRASIESKITDKTRAIVINSPHNPVGKVLSMEELEMIADICIKHDLLCISDEVYEWLVFNGAKHTRIATFPGMWERTLTISSGGKTFGVTGWKVGWIIGPENLIRSVQAVHTDVTFHVPTPIQEAVATCIERETPLLGTSESHFAQLAELTTKRMEKIASFLTDFGFVPMIPEGGYFMLADFSKVDTGVDLNEYDKSDDPVDYKFIRWLAKEKGIALVPPSAFYGADNKALAGTNVRVCLMKADSSIEKAAELLKKIKK